MVMWQGRLAVERIRCGIARRIGLDVDLLNKAVSVDELHPSETTIGSPCIVLPGQYERVRGGAFNVNVAKEIAELGGAPRKIGPTVRYVLEDVIVSNSIIYGQGRKKLFNYNIRRDRAELPWAEYDEVALRSSFIGCYFFGEWLGQDCATHLLPEQSDTIMSM